VTTTGGKNPYLGGGVANPGDHAKRGGGRVRKETTLGRVKGMSFWVKLN